MKLYNLLGITTLATLVCGSAIAQGPLRAPAWQGPMAPSHSPNSTTAVPFYTNLVNSTCTSCNYDASNGFLVLGPTNCFSSGSTQWLAYPFIAGHTGVVRRIDAAITLDSALCTSTSNQVTLSIWSDNCTGMPVTQLAAGKAMAPAAPCDLASANIRNGPTLTQGATYWVVAQTVGAAQSAFTGVWWETNTAQYDVNFNDGSGWQNVLPASPGAFDVF